MISLPASPYAERALIILNPAAGQENVERTRRRIGGAFAVRTAGFDLVETRAAGDAERLAREAVSRGYSTVVAAGGDGTIAEVITGLAGSDVPLGIIPLGTGNQLANNLEIPGDVDRAAAVVIHGHTRRIDIGQLESGRFFALIAGAGWDAEVMAACTRDLKERWGFGAYLFAGLRSVTAPPSTLFHITADDVRFDVRAATVLIANAGQLFHGFLPVEVQIAPGASFTDGLLDVCIFAPRNLPDVATVLWKVARGQYGGDDRMIYFRAREIRIEADPPTIAQVDGDCIGQTPLAARTVPGGVAVRVP